MGSPFPSGMNNRCGPRRCPAIHNGYLFTNRRRIVAQVRHPVSKKLRCGTAIMARRRKTIRCDDLLTLTVDTRIGPPYKHHH